MNPTYDYWFRWRSKFSTSSVPATARPIAAPAWSSVPPAAVSNNG